MRPLVPPPAASRTVTVSRPAPQPGSRLLSLDAFRGATMALMVLVNDPGDGAHVYAPLEHAAWHGWTVTDVVFPSFLWIAGVAMTLSLGRRVAAGQAKAQLFGQVLKRAAILFALGLLVYLFPRFDFSTMRIMGVLQRIAICYAAGAAIYLTTSWRGQIAWILSLFTAYWLLMTLVPVPGYGAGRLDVEGNLAHYIDRVVLGVHNYAHTKTWDPEGIVSTLPAIGTILLGILAGQVIGAKRVLAERTTWIFLIGNALIVAGLVCNYWMPINKKLWTPSFALFMAGLDYVLLAGVLWVADGLGRGRLFRPFAVLGMNAIAIYMASEGVDSVLTALHWREPIYHAVFAPLAPPFDASLLYAVVYTLAMWLLAWLMYRRRWFWRI